jgi:hypothetical protein
MQIAKRRLTDKNFFNYRIRFSSNQENKTEYTYENVRSIAIAENLQLMVTIKAARYCEGRLSAILCSSGA